MHFKIDIVILMLLNSHLASNGRYERAIKLFAITLKRIIIHTSISKLFSVT
ncbi:hypothetical protein [Psychrobacillus sp. MER TA 171]|uniref:hypothetical protein n=1 Tax=Psychrobacillus sp. MER TA 171 TaxID=2939577 RepID=UPI00204041D2|nr:hypothetical protein [Psychrobacillus sp. MER TA 171]MCM3359668.1 hypothetical protein [Psychrobacillus sp. MER TA 171]